MCAPPRPSAAPPQRRPAVPPAHCGRPAGAAPSQAERGAAPLSLVPGGGALEWAVRTLWRARRAHHRRSGPRRDDMPSPAKACRHGLLRRPWPLPPAAPVSSRDGLAAARCVESAPGRGQRGHGKCSREESRPRAGDVANGGQPARHEEAKRSTWKGGDDRNGKDNCGWGPGRYAQAAGMACTSAEARDRSRVIAWQSAVHLQRRSSRCRTQFAA